MDKKDIDSCRSQDVKNKEDYNQERIKKKEMLDEEEKMLEGEKWSKKDEMLEEKMSEERRWNKKNAQVSVDANARADICICRR